MHLHTTIIRTTGLGTVTIGLWLGWVGGTTTWARDFRVNQLPNGNVMRCANCHINPNGGGTRTAFGNRVFQIIGGSSGAVPFWSANLAREDADGDGYCNGQELREPDGDGVPIDSVGVTNPGASSSRPANTPPSFTSNPVTEAIQGLSFEYQAEATDPDACQTRTFTKAAGPAWLSVAPNGLVSGTPPDGAGGEVTVTVQAQDNATPTPGTALQTFTLSVVATYAGWQTMHFNLPAEAGLAGPTHDPDGDGTVNALEYAYRTNPRSASPAIPPALGFTPSGQLSMSVDLRDDDPSLTARLEAGDALPLTTFATVSGTLSDPVVGDGLKTWTFVDSVVRTSVLSRFARLLVLVQP